MATSLWDMFQTLNPTVRDPIHRALEKSLPPGSLPAAPVDIQAILASLRASPGAAPGFQQATPPADPLAQLGILDPEQRAIPGAALPIGPRRQSAATGLMPSIGEPPSPRRPDAGMDDTRFMGPRGEQAPGMDLGAATLPAGPAERQPPRHAMAPDDRLRKLKAARMLAEGLGRMYNVTSASEVEMLGRAPDDRATFAEDLRGEEERVRRGDFENPQSPASRMARQMLSEATGQEVPETMSAAAVMGISPVFEQMIRQRFQGENRRFQQDLAIEREDRAARGEARHVSERREDIQRGREKELRAAISGERKEMLSPTGQLGKYREGLEMTDKALALLEQGGAQAFGTALSLIIKGIGKEAGNIAQKEREVLLGEIGIPGLVTKGIKAWTGDYTPEQYEAMKNVARKARELLERDRTAHRSQRLDTFYSTHRELLDEGGIGRDGLEERLGLGEDAGSPGGSPEPATESAGAPGADTPRAARGAMITVRASNGKLYRVPGPAKAGDTFRAGGESLSVVEEVRD